MYDYKLDERQSEYRKTTVTSALLSTRERLNLSLRKDKLDEMILNKRLKKSSANFSSVNDNHIIYCSQENSMKTSIYDISLGNMSLKFNSTSIEAGLLNVYTSDKNSFISNFEREIHFIFKQIDVKNFDSSLDNIKYALFLIRLYISLNEQPNVSNLKEHGLIEKIEILLENATDEYMIYEIYWILTNFSYLCGYEENKSLISDKFINFHVKFLNSENIELLDQIIWGITNISCEDRYFRDILFKSPILDKIRSITYNAMNSNEINLLKSCTNFLYHSLNGNLLGIDLYESILKIFPVINRLVLNTTGEIFSNSLWALMSITRIEDTSFRFTIYNTLQKNNGEVLVKLLSLDPDILKNEIISVIRIIGNFLSVEDENFIEYILNLNIFSYLDKIMATTKNKNVKSEIILAIICFIKEESKKQFTDFLNSNLFNRILIVANEYDLKLKKDAVILIHKICNNINYNITTHLIKKGTFRVLIELLENTYDHEIIINCLFSIDKIISTGVFLKDVIKSNNIAISFEKAGGCDCLEKFQAHSNNHIYTKAMGILDKYFDKYSDKMLVCHDLKVDEIIENFSQGIENDCAESNLNQIVNYSDYNHNNYEMH